MTRVALALLVLAAAAILLRRRSALTPEEAALVEERCQFPSPGGGVCGLLASHRVHVCVPRYHVGLPHPNISCHSYMADYKADGDIVGMPTYYIELAPTSRN